MAASKIKVNTDRLNQTRNSVQTRLELIVKNIQQISENMNALNATWTGDAHETFEKSTTSDIQKLQDVCKGLEGIVKYENNAVKEYNRCEQQVSDIIRQIRV